MPLPVPEVGVTPVSGAPDGRTETWPLPGAGVGAADGARVGSADGADGTGEGCRVGSAVGVGEAAEGRVWTGLGVAESANAGVAAARRAVQVSARALNVVRRMDSLSFVGPPVLPCPAGWVTGRAERRGSCGTGCKEMAKSPYGRLPEVR